MPGGLGESFLVSFLFPHVNQAEGAKEFELNNLARNIPTNFTGLRIERITVANADWRDWGLGLGRLQL